MKYIIHETRLYSVSTAFIIYFENVALLFDLRIYCCQGRASMSADKRFYEVVRMMRSHQLRGQITTLRTPRRLRGPTGDNKPPPPRRAPHRGRIHHDTTFGCTLPRDPYRTAVAILLYIRLCMRTVMASGGCRAPSGGALPSVHLSNTRAVIHRRCGGEQKHLATYEDIAYVLLRRSNINRLIPCLKLTL